jgi:hypothetical protein
MLGPGRFRSCLQRDTTVVPTSINTRATFDFKQIHCPLWCHSTRNAFTSLVLCVFDKEIKKNPQFSVSLISRESEICRMIIALKSWDIVFCEIAFLLNEATGFYSMGKYLFNKTSGLMVRGNGFCPETIHVSYSNRNNNKHYPAVLKPMAARSKAARLLGLRVRISRGAWMSVSCECCVLSGGVLFDGPIARPEETCRVWYV